MSTNSHVTMAVLLTEYYILANMSQSLTKAFY